MNPLVTFEYLDTCMAESDTVPVFVFKHSTACPISSGAYRSVAEYESKSHEGDPRVWMVKVIEDRPVSNQIAELLGVQHKSPQLILVHHREAVWSASHHGIYEKRIREVVTENRGRFPTREG